jgi:hypothetical protein
MSVYPRSGLPACLLQNIRKLEAYATVLNQQPLAQKGAVHANADSEMPAEEQPITMAHRITGWQRVMLSIRCETRNQAPRPSG